MNVELASLVLAALVEAVILLLPLALACGIGIVILALVATRPPR